MKRISTVITLTLLAIVISSWLIAGCGSDGGGGIIIPTQTSTSVPPTLAPTAVIITGTAMKNGAVIPNAYVGLYPYTKAVDPNGVFTTADPNGYFSFTTAGGYYRIQIWETQAQYDPNNPAGAVNVDVTQSSQQNITVNTGTLQPTFTPVVNPTSVPTTTPTTQPTSITTPTNAPTTVATNTPVNTPVSTPTTNTSGFLYNGVTYSGKGEIINSGSAVTSSDSNIVITEPKEKSFKADGFFTIKGSVTYTGAYQYTLVKVSKDSDPNTLVTSYWLRNSFEKKLWLRFGQGAYTVKVYKTEITDGNLNYEGDINGWTYWTPPVYTFSVTNTNTIDGTYYYPSDVSQSDDTQIMTLASGLIAGKTTTQDKARAIHDYVCKYLYYDDASLVSGQRKKQDALSALTNKTAVCEGYTNLYDALMRAAGIKTKYVGGDVTNDGSTWGLHAWSNVLDSTWYFVDTTWDDPKPNDHDPNHVVYTYFWLTYLPTDHRNPTEDVGKNTQQIIPQKLKGYPDGIY